MTRGLSAVGLLLCAACAEQAPDQVAGSGGAGGFAAAGGLAGAGNSAGNSAGQGGAAGTAGEAGGAGGFAGGGAGHAGTAGANGGFETVPGFPSMTGQRLGSQHRSDLVRLRAEGNDVWVGWINQASTEFTSRALQLERFGSTGIKVRASPLKEIGFDDFLVVGGDILSWRHDCAEGATDPCFHWDRNGSLEAGPVWRAVSRDYPVYRVDDAGDVVAAHHASAQRRHVSGASTTPDGVVALTHEGAYRLASLDHELHERWSTELLPAVDTELDPNAPLDELIRRSQLVSVSVSDPAVLADGSLAIAATLTRGSLAALLERDGGELSLPADPRCGDVVVFHYSAAGSALGRHQVSTSRCETLPVLTTLGSRVLVASVVAVPKQPAPNDSDQYDTDLAIVDVSTGVVSSGSVLGEAEDDIPHGITPCGTDQVCVVGLTGSRTVDTGSRVTFGKGYLAVVSSDGPSIQVRSVHVFGELRHTLGQGVVATASDGVRLFATTNGPITHTADADPSLGFNQGYLLRAFLD